ncbi:MAG TPA: CPBP family intramembrane metalloprotease [Bacteroidales bacterium]|nr:CPBP family intramembrane metalloprotease [Bacteroidales bacterium]
MSSFLPELSTKIPLLTDSDMYEISILKTLQFISALFSFLIPAIIINKLFSNKEESFLSYKTSPTVWFYLLIPVFLISIMPLMNIIIQWNESIVLPDSMSSMETKIKEMEGASQKMIELMLSGTTVYSILINIVLVAILPALGEEFLFRGILQKHFKELFGNPHIAIFVAAFLFSAIHFQFYGFVPRLILGMIFGYLVYFTGSIWPAVFAHFFNNFMAISVTYLSKSNEIIAETDSFGTKSADIYFVLIGVLFASLIGWIIIKKKV